MAITINPTVIPSPRPKLLFNEASRLTHLARTKHSSTISLPSLTVKCSSNAEPGESSAGGGGGGNLKEALSGMVDQRVEELLNREENKVLLDGLEKAAQRVETAKRELAEIEKQEIEAKKLRDYINQLESRASEIEECQKEISDARAMVEEAERALSIDFTAADNGEDIESEEIDKSEERWESIKAAGISALIGTLAGLPIASTQVAAISDLLLPVATTFVSCALFGVTFRYAVRRDLDDSQLKTGTAAAFGFVKGLATLEGGPPLELEAGSLLSHAFNGAIYVSENVLIFVFAAVGLDLCYKMRLLSPFPIKKSIPKSEG